MMIKKIRSYEKGLSAQAGMSYVELIVVLGIFAALSSVALYNYGDFQARVDIRNLASDIALKIIEAQKSSVSGKLPPPAQQSQTGPTWKPSYGVYIDRVADNKSFIYFTDLDQNGYLANPTCTGISECLEKITITKGNTIPSLEVFGAGCPVTITNLGIVFKRPDSSAIITSSPPLSCTSISYAQITITSPKATTATIKMYPSGRIQVN